MKLGIAGKTALVCASTSGLGRATATSLAADGARVVITGRTEERAKEVAEGIPGAIGIGVDLVAPGGAASLLEQATLLVGAVDILVLNGPGPAPGSARTTDHDGIDSAIETLIHPQVTLIRGALPTMIKRGWGRILSISSMSIQTPIPNLALSNLGRAGLAGYLKTLATEVAGDGVTVNSLLPGRVATPRAHEIDVALATATGRSVAEVESESVAVIPARRYGDPAEFGAVAAFLCSTHAGYLTGTSIRFDGGMAAHM